MTPPCGRCKGTGRETRPKWVSYMYGASEPVTRLCIDCTGILNERERAAIKQKDWKLHLEYLECMDRNYESQYESEEERQQQEDQVIREEENN